MGLSVRVRRIQAASTTKNESSNYNEWRNGISFSPNDLEALLTVVSEAKE